MMSLFNKIRDLYTDAREVERKRIIDYLAEQKDENGAPLFLKREHKEYENNNYRYKGGQGLSNYGEKRWKNPHDLSNHKYIETEYRGVPVFISMQSFDIDPRSKNIHLLYDRIGIYVGDGLSDTIDISRGDEKKPVSVSDMFLKMKTTEYELPLTDDDLEELVEYIKKEYEKKK